MTLHFWTQEASKTPDNTQFSSVFIRAFCQGGCLLTGFSGPPEDNGNDMLLGPIRRMR